MQTTRAPIQRFLTSLIPTLTARHVAIALLIHSLTHRVACAVSADPALLSSHLTHVQLSRVALSCRIRQPAIFFIAQYLTLTKRAHACTYTHILSLCHNYSHPYPHPPTHRGKTPIIQMYAVKQEDFSDIKPADRAEPTHPTPRK